MSRKHHQCVHFNHGGQLDSSQARGVARYLKCSIPGTITIFQIDFINLFIFNCLTSNINLFIFNCLTSNVCFPKNISFASRRERLFIDTCPQFRILNSPGKIMTYYLRDTNKFLRYRILCTSILKCGFPTKGIKLTRFVLFETLGAPQL